MQNSLILSKNMIQGLIGMQAHNFKTLIEKVDQDDTLMSPLYNHMEKANFSYF